jgi:hypothetical protein
MLTIELYVVHIKFTSLYKLGVLYIYPLETSNPSEELGKTALAIIISIPFM